MPEKSQNKVLKRIILLGSGVAFMGSSAVFLVGALNNNTPQVQEEVVDSSPIESPRNEIDARLKQRELGYQQILEKEPENRYALEGLGLVRIQMQDLPGAIEPIQKLTELYPETQQYKDVLASLKQQVSQNNEVKKEKENSK